MLIDQLFFLRRVGFTSFLLRADQDHFKAVAKLRTFSDAYQGAADNPLPAFRRQAATECTRVGRARQMSHAQTAEPRVYFVGAGPGAADLLTLRAVRVLARGDYVLHDALVEASVLELAPRAQRIAVGKRAQRPSTAQRFINKTLVDCARKASCVVRLKGGDPSVFGRLDEEMQALRAAGIAFEVVPGITAASAGSGRVARLSDFARCRPRGNVSDTLRVRRA